MVITVHRYYEGSETPSTEYIPVWNVLSFRKPWSIDKSDCPNAQTTILVRSVGSPDEFHVEETIENITEQLGKFAELLELFLKMDAVLK